jgi:hypothetical protein
MDFITLERYAKICHAIWHRKHFRRWMLKVGVILSWLNGICVFWIPSWATTKLDDGKCRRFVWPTKQMSQAYTLSILFWQVLIPLTIFAVLYWRIIAVIRRQSHMVGPVVNAASAGQVTQIEKNVVKTMIYVTVCFGVC